MRQRFTTAANLLHGAAALPAARAEVTVADWSVYLRAVSSQLDYGVVGLGYIERVARGRLDALEAKIRAQGEAGFTVQRAGKNEWLDLVVAIEPRERNTGVLGLDIGSGNTRRTAAEDTARRNEMILSRRIRLDYDGQHRNVPGFLLLLPVFQKGIALPPPEQRLGMVAGWVYAPIRIDELMIGVAETAGNQLDFEVFEGNGTQPDTLLYDMDGLSVANPGLIGPGQYYPDRTFTSIIPLDLYGRRWTLRFSTRPEFDATDRKSTRLNSSHPRLSRMPSSA